MTGTLNFGK